MRRCHRLLDKTKSPHKVYKYGYVPDPRKFAPIESVSQKELFPVVIRPPCRAVPSVEEFLEKSDYDDRLPIAEHKSMFESWNHMMKIRSVEYYVGQGMSRKAARYFRNTVNLYTNGQLPCRFDNKEERLYWRQFKAQTKDESQRRIPELPKNYRPHQMGQDQRPIPDYLAMNAKPQWALDEEARLAK